MFPGGKCKAVRHKMFSLWVRAEGQEKEIKHAPPQCFKSQVEEGYGGTRNRGSGFHWRCREGGWTREQNPSGGGYMADPQEGVENGTSHRYERQRP